MRTIEGEIRQGLVRLRLARGASEVLLDVASRTDRGVSARGNALALRSNLPGEALLRALNGIAPEIWFTRLARVPEDFRPRSAAERWYRYWERPAKRVPKAWRVGARLFQGEIDVRSFGRGLSSDVPVRRTIRSLEVDIRSEWLVMDIHARSFVWGMVRKIVSALRSFEAGTLALDDLRDALDGKVRLPLPLAEPERLVLWETSYPIPWEIERREAMRRQAEHLRVQRLLAGARVEILTAIAPSAATTAPPPSG